MRCKEKSLNWTHVAICILFSRFRRFLPPVTTDVFFRFSCNCIYAESLLYMNLRYVESSLLSYAFAIAGGFAILFCGFMLVSCAFWSIV